MPVSPTYPGVYIEEIPSGVRTITGVATSITAFIGRALRGAVNEPVRIQSFVDFERTFGGLWVHSTMSYAVHHYFLNGGTDAIIIRVVHIGDDNPDNDASKATLTIEGINGPLKVEAESEGAWGNNLRARVDYDTHNLQPSEAADSLFNLTVNDLGTGVTESFHNISTDPKHARFVTHVLEQESTFVSIAPPCAVPATRPTNHPYPPSGKNPFDEVGFHEPSNNDGHDGIALTDADITGSEVDKTGLFALEKADLFNLFCIPPLTRKTDVDPGSLRTALAYCKKRRAMLIVDPPSNWRETSNVTASDIGVDSLNLRDEDAAIFFPRVRMSDPIKENRLEEFAPCGAVAGIFARIDAQHGVWKAPAGMEAILTGARELSYKLTDDECGQLNTLGVNCLRTFPVIGNVVWGARTLEGADRLSSDWKYIPVRRTALFIEESLFQSLKWVVFEPNDESLWAQIRLNIGAFMHNLFRQGAFQGTTPRDAYFVKCDKETTTQNDIGRGIVNIIVGFAPLKPAEFVAIKIQQIAGQIET